MERATVVSFVYPSLLVCVCVFVGKSTMFKRCLLQYGDGYDEEEVRHPPFADPKVLRGDVWSRQPQLNDLFVCFLLRCVKFEVDSHSTKDKRREFGWSSIGKRGANFDVIANTNVALCS